MSMSLRFLSWRGRMPRAAFNASWLAVLCVAWVLSVFLDARLGEQSSLWLYPPVAWCLLCLLARRLHDHGKSLASLLWGLVPLFGPLYLLVLLCTRRGVAGENQYGDDLLERGADYLQVVF